MRTVVSLLALTSVATLTLLTGCPGIGLGCGGFSGGGDQVYQRGSNDVLILCENGGFVERMNAQPEVDGFATDQDETAGDTVVVGTVNNTQAVAFTLTEDLAAGTATAPELGAGTFQTVQLGQVELNSANQYCLQVESQAWFASGGPE